MVVRDWQRIVLISLFFATACARQPAPLPTAVQTPAPTAAALPRGGSVTASGKIVPDKKVAMGFPVAGRVQTLAVAVGDRVEADTLLVMQEQSVASANLSQAQASLLQAQAFLAELRTGPRAQELVIAQAEVAAAEAQLAQLTEPALAADIVAAKADVAAAQAAGQQLLNGPREEERVAAQATLSNTLLAIQQAQLAYAPVAWRYDVEELPETRQLQEALNNHAVAQARYDALFAEPDVAVIAANQARVQHAQAALDRLLSPSLVSEIAAANAQVDIAQAKLDLLTSGVLDETITAAEAAVTAAEAAVQRAQAELDNTALHAPFTGVVTELTVNEGEMVQPGMVVLTLADLTHMQAETIDLSERDVGQVAVGQAATTFVEALNLDLAGHVIRIAPQATIIGGDVVYTVVVALDEQSPALRWGMSVEVNIQLK